MPTLRKPKEFYWTQHSRYKMRQYGFSEQRVKRVLHMPMRIEEGIAPKTIAYMQKAGSKAHPYEIWVMITDEPKRRKVISAWRYPGETKLGTALPDEVLRGLRNSIHGLY
jgi:hypothetical protein